MLAHIDKVAEVVNSMQIELDLAASRYWLLSCV